jgi:hypothetical protein
MERKRLRQLAIARVMYGKPEKKESFFEKINSYFSISRELIREPYQTGVAYAIYKSVEKSHRREMTSTTGAFASQETLERIANS